MALRKIETISGKTFVNVNGLPVQTGGDTVAEVNVYVQVRDITGGKLEVVARVFLINEANGSLVREQFYSFTPDLDGGNFIKQAYDHLKTLPEFADAVDC